MIRTLVATSLLVALSLGVYAACTSARRTAQNATPVDLDLEGVATARVPSTFRLAGIVNSGERKRFGGRTTSLEYHLDTRRLTFALEAQQRTVLGGYRADPVLMHVTLYERAVPNAFIAEVTSTTIDRFYPPTDDASELAARFASAGWLPDVPTGAVAGQAVERAADVAKASSEPARWLVIHADPARRVRVDLYAWQKLYTLAEARALVRDVAASVRTTPGVQAHFDGIATFDARMAARHDSTVRAAIAALGACGIAGLTPDRVAFGDQCAAWLSPDRRYLRVARAVGQLPRVAATAKPRVNEPSFPIAPEIPEMRVTTIYWDAAAARWVVEGLQGSIYEDEDRENPLIDAIDARLTRAAADRATVYLARFRAYDLEFHGDHVDVPVFLAESARHEAALRGGKVIAGVPVEGFRFPR